MIGWCVDYEDASNPPDDQFIRSNVNYRETLFNKPVTIKFRPKPQTVMYNGLVGTAYSPGSKPIWINSINAAVPHYGLKYSVRNFAANQKVYWHISYTMYASFKAVGNL